MPPNGSPAASRRQPGAPEDAGLLIGDISGVLSFLYGFHEPKGAAATLRARSFYVQLLAEVREAVLARIYGGKVDRAAWKYVR